MAIRAGSSAALLVLAVVLLSAAPCLQGNDGIRNSRPNPHLSLSLSRCRAVPTGNLAGPLRMPRWSGARSAWFPYSRRGNGLRSLRVGLRRSGLGFGPSLRGLDRCCLFSDCGGMRSCGNGWNLPSERSAVTEVLRVSSYFVVSVGSTLVKQISDLTSYCCRISD
jgi:hypothetical protein